MVSSPVVFFAPARPHISLRYNLYFMIFLSEIEERIKRQTEDGYRIYIQDLIVNSQKVNANYLYGREINGYMRYFGVREIIAAYMQEEGLSVAQVLVRYNKKNNENERVVTEDSFNVLYANSSIISNQSGLTADQLMQSIFMSPRKVAWSYPGDTFIIGAYNPGGETVDVHFLWSFDDGTQNEEIDDEVIDSIGYNEIPCYNSGPSITSVKVSWNSREMTIFYLPDSQVERFRFRNVFNVWEIASFSATVSSDPSEEQDTVYQDEVLKAYDREQKLEIKLETAALPAFMYDTLLAMCRADKVQYKENGTWYDIVITEFKFPKSNEPNTPIVLELTFEFANAERLEEMEY